MTPREQRNHIAEGDYEWCEQCRGDGTCHYADEPSHECHFCDGEGIVFCGDEHTRPIEDGERVKMGVVA